MKIHVYQPPLSIGGGGSIIYSTPKKTSVNITIPTPTIPLVQENKTGNETIILNTPASLGWGIWILLGIVLLIIICRVIYLFIKGGYNE